MAVRSEVRSVRRAELVSMLSLAADLDLGQPMQHCWTRNFKPTARGRCSATTPAGVLKNIEG